MTTQKLHIHFQIADSSGQILREAHYTSHRLPEDRQDATRMIRQAVEASTETIVDAYWMTEAQYQAERIRPTGTKR